MTTLYENEEDYIDMQDDNFNVAGSIRIIETMKCNLLTDVAGIYQDMLRMDPGNKSEISEKLADIILTAYLLGKQLGVGYNVMGKKLENKLRLFLLDEGTDSLFGIELAELVEHLKKE